MFLPRTDTVPFAEMTVQRSQKRLQGRAPPMIGLHILIGHGTRQEIQSIGHTDSMISIEVLLAGLHLATHLRAMAIETITDHQEIYLFKT